LTLAQSELCKQKLLLGRVGWQNLKGHLQSFLLYVFF
jgi:hypothetical protein